MTVSPAPPLVDSRFRGNDGEGCGNDEEGYRYEVQGYRYDGQDAGMTGRMPV